jgi:hypothetical protein
VQDNRVIYEKYYEEGLFWGSGKRYYPLLDSRNASSAAIIGWYDGYRDALRTEEEK